MFAPSKAAPAAQKWAATMPSLIGQKKAAELGYAQVLWLDGVHRKYVDEVGAMNVFSLSTERFTPPRSRTALYCPASRASCIELLRDGAILLWSARWRLMGLSTNAAGKLNEAFGTGTAAVISPIGELCDGGEQIILRWRNRLIAQRLYDELTAIQWGKVPDTRGWSVPID